jgi:hypothetical protein
MEARQDNKELLIQFIEEVWNEGNVEPSWCLYAALPRLCAGIKQ